jgi:hypothetical protein
LIKSLIKKLYLTQRREGAKAQRFLKMVLKSGTMTVFQKLADCLKSIKTFAPLHLGVLALKITA